ITDEIVGAYIRLHRLGVAHSVEAWAGSQLVGGVYGVEGDGAFAAESMFYRGANAFQLALLHLVALRCARRLDCFDLHALGSHAAPGPRCRLLPAAGTLPRAPVGHAGARPASLRTRSVERAPGGSTGWPPCYGDERGPGGESCPGTSFIETCSSSSTIDSIG